MAVRAAMMEIMGVKAFVIGDSRMIGVVGGISIQFRVAPMEILMIHRPRGARDNSRSWLEVGVREFLAEGLISDTMVSRME